MKIDILTLFPEMFQGALQSSILKRAQEKDVFDCQLVDFREYADNKHKKVDDYPYGGGQGMVLTAQPIVDAIEDLQKKTQTKARVILLCPQGETYTQKKAEQLAEEEHLIMVCGHYEGYDERIRSYVTDEISIGDFVLTGGEIGALTIMDSVVRLLPDSLGNEASAVEDSFSTGILEHPQYTRPANFRGMEVPEVLLQGHHAKIDEWRHKEALRRTFERRPDLLKDVSLDEKDQQWIASLKKQKEIDK